MQKYSYVALTPEGKTIRGTMVAQSDEEIRQLVTKNGNYCLSYTRLKDESKGNKALPIKEVVNFCSQLGSILKAGVPLATGLDMLYNKTDKGPLKKVIGNVYEMVQKGSSLSDALVKQGKTFPPMMINMVKAGEMSGDLDSSLNKLADHFEKDLKLRNQIKSAMRYPKTLALITAAVVVLLVSVVLPRMTSGMENIPALTKFLLDMSEWIKVNWPYILIAGVVLYFAIPMIKNIPQVRFGIDKLKCRMPRIGKLVRMVYTARFARNLATLYEGGIQLIDAITMATQIVGNKYIEKCMEEALVRVKKGESMSKAIGSVDVFDPLLTSMLYVGEESGVLSEVLTRVADYFDEESNNATKALTGMLEPVMMIIMAVVIGTILMAVLMPMFQQYDEI
ncbi:MAG: type II secretion system F family protein [Clostridia bacterium]|nr:type II secretion system F family protein [Clostridia bacterium]